MFLSHESWPIMSKHRLSLSFAIDFFCQKLLVYFLLTCYIKLYSMLGLRSKGVYFRKSPALSFTCASKKLMGEGGWNYTEVVDLIVKGRMNRKGSWKNSQFFFRPPYRILHWRSDTKTTTNYFSHFAGPFQRNTHFQLYIVIYIM